MTSGTWFHQNGWTLDRSGDRAPADPRGATESIVFSLVPYGELPEGMYRLAIEGMYAEFMLLQSCVRDS